jgi:hypothetical protein
MKALRTIVHGLFLAAVIGLTFGIALAQAATDPALPTIPGLDPALAAALVGLLASYLVRPLNALGKKWFGYEGFTSQIVAFLLATLVVGVIAFFQGQYGNGFVGVWQAAVAVVTAWVKAMGDHSAAKIASGLPTGKANQLPTVSNEVASDPTIPLGGR